MNYFVRPSSELAEESLCPHPTSYRLVERRGTATGNLGLREDSDGRRLVLSALQVVKPILSLGTFFSWTPVP